MVASAHADFLYMPDALHFIKIKNEGHQLVLILLIEAPALCVAKQMLQEIKSIKKTEC
jgi:hypothetical protein